MTRNTQTVHPPGHVMHMSLDHSKDPTESVARCECGWEHRVTFSHLGWARVEDRAIEEHWTEVSQRKKEQ